MCLGRLLSLLGGSDCLLPLGLPDLGLLVPLGQDVLKESKSDSFEDLSLPIDQSI